MRDQSKQLLQKIYSLSREIGREIVLMGLCGTHSQTISRYGLRSLMPKNVKLIAGPGCPICVTSQKDIDIIVNLALAGIPVATYGDAMRVPGFFGSLEEARRKGAKVFPVYSVDEALKLKNNYPDLVFFGLGFETTVPATVYGVQQGLTVYSAHKLFVPAMQALLDGGEIKIDGFINPGHVSTIIGIKPYQPIKVPQVIAGFESEDVLIAVYLLLRQIKAGRCVVENEYLRAVNPGGNPKAYHSIFDVFNVADAEWRGLGIVPRSGLVLKSKFKRQDAKIKYQSLIARINLSQSQEHPACRCGDILRGIAFPSDCPLFRRVCTPETPCGPCMVSIEGECNIEFTQHFPE